MKKITLIAILILFTEFVAAQSNQDQITSKASDSTSQAQAGKKSSNSGTQDGVVNEIKTSVFTLDLGLPHQNSLKNNDGSNKLVVKTRQPLAFELVNGNPYKYKYVINHKFVDFFNNQNYNPLDSIAERLAVPQTAGKATEPQSTEVNAKDYVVKAPMAIEILKEFKSKYPISSLLNITLNESPKTPEEDLENIRMALKAISYRSNILKETMSLKTSEYMAEDYIDIKEFKKDRKLLHQTYMFILQDIIKLTSDAEKFPDYIKDFRKNVEEVIKINELNKQEIGKMFEVKTSNYIPAIDLNGKNIDLVEITVERYNKTATNPTPEKFTYNIWMKGGVKIDVSPGIYLTTLKDKEYETVDVVENGVTKKLIYEKDLGDFDMGAGALINLSVRGGLWIKPALSIGALFTTDQKFQLLSGLGLIFGKEERIILHGGFSFGSTNQIDTNRYKDDGSQAYDLGAAGNVPTVNKFCSGFFLGVSYNFGKVKKLTNLEAN
jgi:hypothetical protein